MTTATEPEVRRSPLAILLSDGYVLQAGQSLLAAHRRKRRAYAMPRTSVNQQEIARELFFADNDIRDAERKLAEAADRCALRIVQAEPVEVTG